MIPDMSQWTNNVTSFSRVLRILALLTSVQLKDTRNTILNDEDCLC